MKKNLKYYLTCFLILFNLLWFQTAAQQINSSYIETKLKEYIAASPWEEIYVHVDRLSYIAGEDIWFSAYNIDRFTGRASEKSLLAYIELLNPWNHSLIHIRIRLDKGTGSGNIFLPDTLSPGTYTLRAYTGWMKNFLPENCFIQNISVYNPFKNTPFKRKIFTDNIQGERISMKFYPEGGNLVGNVQNRIVARLTDNRGMGIRSEVIVKDNLGNVLSSFATDDYGYGSFNLAPEKGRSYYAEVKGVKFSLPPPLEEGISLSVNYSGENAIGIEINAAGKYALITAEIYHILIHNAGKTIYKADVPSAGVLTKVVVPKVLLGNGVNQLSVFGKNIVPLAERLIYNPPAEVKHSGIITENEYGRREKVTAIVSQGNKNNRPSRLSVSVIPEWQAAGMQNIEEYMVFGSEFGITPWACNGMKTGSLNSNLADNFLVSAYSRWIRWEEILSGKPPVRPYRLETDGGYIYGTIRARDTGLPDTSSVLYMSIPGKTVVFRYAVSGRDGKFSFMVPVDSRTRRLIIQPADTSKNTVLEIESPFPRRVPNAVCFTDTVPVYQMKAASALSFNYQTSRIYLAKYKKEAEAEIIDNVPVRRFYGIPELEVRLDDYIKLPVMQEVFFELVPGVRLRERRSGWEIRVYNPFTNTFYDDPPLTMIDGVVIQNISVIAGLDPESVEKIEVVKSQYLTGELYFSGIINVITRKGNFTNINLPDYAVEMRYRAIEKSGVFVQPDYTDHQKKDSRVPDLRNTLYWNPGMYDFKNGESKKIEFWTSDIAGNYIINIEGVTSEGQIIAIRKLIKVR